jgi:hypothetical protein
MAFRHRQPIYQATRYLRKAKTRGDHDGGVGTSHRRSPPCRSTTISFIVTNLQHCTAMRFVFLLGALAALASAAPHPQDDPTEPAEGSETSTLTFPALTVPLPLTTSLNIPVTTLKPSLPGATTSSRKRPHWEPIPIFTKECRCDIATVRYPCWATDALQASEDEMTSNRRMRTA